jgi:DNA ligase (NAD+)
VKIANLDKAETVLIDVLWDKPSKNGRITPVGIVNPVNIGGATISRVTLNNIEWISQMHLRINSFVTITRSNGVIPKIIEVKKNKDEKEIIAPHECPYCGEKLIRVGVDWCCPNKDCGATGCARIRTFIEKLGIKHVSLRTLSAIGIDNFQNLLKFRANPRYKVQIRFENDLKYALFENDEITIFKALPFRMIAEKTLDKIIDFYGWDFLKEKLSHGVTHFWKDDNMPFGVGALMLDHFSEDAVNNYKILESIIKDSRWNGKSAEEVSNKDTAVKSTGMNVCFTGKLENFSRKSATEFAKAHGFGVLDTVNKNLTFLVTNDTDSGSSKNKKAAQLGVKVINEQQFMEMCGC